MKICFLGTPEFALPSLRMLVEEGYEVAAVFTQPDRRKNRGKKLFAPPVKEYALERGIPVYQPNKIREESAEDLRGIQPDLLVTAAFGQILSQELLDIAPLGCINVHGSLLPKYRGPAPIQWAIINGETQTGITTMYTERGIDTGDMILKQATDILEGETAGELSLRLADLGAAVLRETLVLIEKGEAPRQPQDEAQATYFPMLKKTDGLLDFRCSAREVYNRVRGVSPWPGAYGEIGGETLKIWNVTVDESLSGRPGEILCADCKAGMAVACGSGGIFVEELQAPCCKRMDARDYLRGKELPGECFECL
ncbi:MAG: methionyl-tRNA formyltransferase [Christensenellales bacterium]